VRGLLAALALALLALGGLGTRPAQAGELTPDEERWARTLLDALGANSPLVRASAEQALSALGLDALPVIVEARPGMKGMAAVAGLQRALRAMGLPAVLARLQSLRAAGTSSTKKIDALLAELGHGAVPEQALEATLAAVRDLDLARLPLAVTLLVAERVPDALTRARHATTATAAGLEVDADGDGSRETLVKTGEGRVLDVGVGERRAALAFFARRGVWFAAPASVLRGTLEGVPIELLDSDLDGRFDGAQDHLRQGVGAFRRVGAERRLLLGEGRGAFEVVAADGWVLRVVADPPPPGADPMALRGLSALNRWRSETGRAPTTLDTAKSAKCRRGADYLALNATPGSEARRGGNPHGQDPAKPGSSLEGAEAQASSIIHAGANPAASIATFGATMLHRIHMLGDPASGVGIGAASGAGGGWTLVWGEVPALAPSATPVVVPAPGAVGVPLRIGGEHPPPDEPLGYYDAPHGYPVSATYGGLGLEQIVLRLYFAGGATPLPGRQWSVEKPIARSHASNEASAFFVPEEPLSRATTYEAELTAVSAGRPLRWVWSFRTH